MGRLGSFFGFLVLSTSALAQGVQTGTIRGTVKDQQDLAVPGVTVTVRSPSLQGPRTAISDAAGGYVLRVLPAGDYEVTFDLPGFVSISRQTTVPLGLTIEQSVTVRPSGVAETVNVVAETPAPIATPVVGVNLRHAEIEALATSRTLQAIATLSPGLNENTPNPGQLAINGAFAFDNIFMINGVDISDNLFATAQALLIEDAIEETQVLTSGISAEYGRFSGGVVNAITRSGGNTFSGSFRVNFLNPSWSDETPFEKSNDVTRPDTLNQTYEATFGGPIARDRLWFFGAGRYASLANSITLEATGIQAAQEDNNKRGEIKLTGTVQQNHTIQGGYLNNHRSVTNTSGVLDFTIDPRGLVTTTIPNSYYFANYRAVMGSRTLIEAQYSQRRYAIEGAGGTSQNIVDSPIFSFSESQLYNAPYFDATDPEQRNNRQLTASLTNSWSGGGGHQTKAGHEFFRSQNTGGNSQSSTSYRFNADYLMDAAGQPATDAAGRLIPVFLPGESSLSFYPATRGAVMNIDNNSLYVQDHWTINSRWSADLGARYERAKAQSTGGILGPNDNNRIVPRLATAYDVKGDGGRVIHVTYGQYSGRYHNNLVGGNSPVGNPADIFSVYQGPAGQGLGFAPGFNVSNYPVTPENASVSVPTANVFVDPDTTSPLTHEFTLSYGVGLARGKGYAEATFIGRKTTNMIEDFTTRADGTTNVVAYGIDAGEISNQVFRNTDLAQRQYRAMVFQSRYRLTSRWTVQGHYTLELTNDGNYEGEDVNAPGAPSLIGDYPEAYTAARNFPDGRLDNFQRHRMRMWSIYNFGLGRFGDLSVSGLWRVESGASYSLAAAGQPLTPIQRSLIAAAGYPDVPGTATVYFGPRGSELFAGFGLLDTDISYNIPVYRDVTPWVKFDVYNLFNNDKLISWNTTIRPDPSSPLDDLGYRTGYLKGANFGQGMANRDYPPGIPGGNGGRTFRVAAGIRF